MFYLLIIIMHQYLFTKKPIAHTNLSKTLSKTYSVNDAFVTKLIDYRLRFWRAPECCLLFQLWFAIDWDEVNNNQNGVGSQLFIRLATMLSSKKNVNYKRHTHPFIIATLMEFYESDLTFNRYCDKKGSSVQASVNWTNWYCVWHLQDEEK